MFLHFRTVRLEAKIFTGGTATGTVHFTDGCNIVLTDNNTHGKSSLVNAMAVGLGFDDLVKSNVAALVKDTVKLDGDDFHITDSWVYVDIENERGERLTVKREVKPELAKGVVVQFAPLSSWKENQAEELYLGTGSYSDTKGFHRVLSEFIGFPMVQVVSQDDSAMRLYLEYIMSAIFIEQKRGWADIMANSPFYRVRDPKKSTIAEILGLDYIKNNLYRNELKLEVDRLKVRYNTDHDNLRRYLNSRHFSLKGVPVEIEHGVWNPQILRGVEGQDLRTLAELIDLKNATLQQKQLATTIPDTTPVVPERVKEIADTITRLVNTRTELDFSISNRTNNIRRYEQRMDTLQSDLDKNKEEIRIRKIFNRDRWSIEKSCPVCDQEINETLLSQVTSFPTMSLDDNVKYISEQITLLRDVLVVERAGLEQARAQSGSLSEQISELFVAHGEIQKSLSGVIPAELMAQAREIAKLEQDLENMSSTQEFSSDMLSRLKQLYDRFVDSYAKLGKLRNDLSTSDKDLLTAFQDKFRSYLQRLNFDSFEAGAMVIDENTFTPRVVITNAQQRKRVRPDFGSSASDWIRIIMAFTLALHASRTASPKSKHPGFSVFDEPRQQTMNLNDYLKFFDLVADLCRGGEQVIIAATDEDHQVRRKATQLGLNVIDFAGEYVLTKTP